jgi:hypothetical protein
MHTSSLPTTSINLQKQPRDAHKFITNHCNQFSETAQRCTQIPAKDFVGQFKGCSPGTTWSKVCHGAHWKLCLRLSLTQPSALCCSLQSHCQLANVSASGLKMSFVKEARTLHLLRWKRKMSQPFLPLHCSVLYNLHT